MGWKLSDLVRLFPLRDLTGQDAAPVDGGSSSDSPALEGRLPGLPTKEDTISSCWEYLTRTASRSSSGPLPGCSDPTSRSLEDTLKKGTYSVKIKKGIKRKDLFRFLLAKMLYEGEEGLHLDEFLVLWELYLYLLEVQSKDPTFREKYGHFFDQSSYFFRALGETTEFPIRVEDNSNLQYLERIQECLKPLLPTRSAYFGLKGQKSLKSGFSLVFEGEVLRRRLPEPRRIGVGYRDKGSRRDPALNGCPDWREVAMSTLELRIRDVEFHTGKLREESTFDWDLVYNLSRLSPDDHSEEDDSSYPL